jgi:hypothetical protein
MAASVHGGEDVMSEKDFTRELLEEAERIDREEIATPDEDAEGRWIFVRPRRAKDPSQIYSLRLPVTVVEQIRVIAASKGEAPTALLRDWLIEHLDDALKEIGEGSSESSARQKKKGIPGSEGAAIRSKTRVQRKASGSARAAPGRKTATRAAAKGSRRD